MKNIKARLVDGKQRPTTDSTHTFSAISQLNHTERKQEKSTRGHSEQSIKYPDGNGSERWKHQHHPADVHILFTLLIGRTMLILLPLGMPLLNGQSTVHSSLDPAPSTLIQQHGIVTRA